MLDIQPNNLVIASAEKDGIVYLGGYFTMMNNVARSRVAAFNKSTGALTGFDPSFDNWVQTICAGTDYIAFGGYFRNVSYKGQQLTDCNGIAFYDIANDVFITPTLTRDYANPIIYKILHHASSACFYIVGVFKYSFTSINGFQSNGVTACFGFRESDGGLIDLGIRSASIYEACYSGVIKSDVLYLGIASSVNLPAYTITDPTSISAYDTWRPVFGLAQRCLADIDNNIWGYAQSPSNYKATPTGSSTAVGTIVSVSPTNATLQAPTTSGMTTSTYNFMGGQAIIDMWEDASYIYALGGFWGMGPTGFDPYNVLGGICKISKTNYLPIGDTHDIRYNTTLSYMGAPFQYLQGGVAYCKYIDGNDVYIFGNIPTIDGFRRDNIYAPYIINADFSKKQLCSTLWV